MYRPRTKETRALYGQFLSLLAKHLGDLSLSDFGILATAYNKSLIGFIMALNDDEDVIRGETAALMKELGLDDSFHLDDEIGRAHV